MQTYVAPGRFDNRNFKVYATHALRFKDFAISHLLLHGQTGKQTQLITIITATGAWICLFKEKPLYEAADPSRVPLLVELWVF